MPIPLPPVTTVYFLPLQIRSYFFSISYKCAFGRGGGVLGFFPEHNHFESHITGFSFMILFIIKQNSTVRIFMHVPADRQLGCYQFSVQFSCSVVSDSLPPHESQHARPPCPSPTPGIHSCECEFTCPCVDFKKLLCAFCVKLRNLEISAIPKVTRIFSYVFQLSFYIQVQDPLQVNFLCETRVRVHFFLSPYGYPLVPAPMVEMIILHSVH